MPFIDVGVLTFHRASNYGAVLQAWALQQAIATIGATGEVVDYRSPFLEEHYRPNGWRTFLSPRKTGIALLRNGYMLDRRDIFADFVRREIPMSPRLYTPGSIDHALTRYSNFVTGSDQVWNPVTAGFDASYFLDFVPESDRKRAYAASVGLEAMPIEHLVRFRWLVSDFEHISVRESPGARILDEVTGARPPVVVDPTLLLDADEWQALGQQGRSEQEPYTLVYLLAENRRTLQYARTLAKARGNRVLYISQRLMRPHGMEVISRATPYDFVSLMAGAQSVVTNSFHGMAFALNFARDLHFDLLPAPARVNSRLMQLADDFDIGSRQIPPRGVLERMGFEEHERIQPKIARKRTQSFDVLRRAVSKD